MIGALAARALSDVGPRELASTWGGTGLAVPVPRAMRPGAGAVLRPRREHSAI